ncbi:tRNA-splicing endonuclease subunit [Sporothrix epigloea]|uniref:tRNA-intron lyase n=1 Tax=Sporothrix epigloea TaxID=1892477 RepID=A0ABP0E1R8_9PEZI
MALPSHAAEADRLSVLGYGDPSSTKEKEQKIRISNIGGRYLVFDVADVARLRRQHNMCAILVGITPQAPNQNVFSSLPLELTADEVRWLVHERGAAYVVDDLQAHLNALAQPAVRRAYLQSVRRQQHEAQVAADEVAAQRERRGAEIRANQAAKNANRKSKKATGASTSKKEIETERVMEKRPKDLKGEKAAGKEASEAPSVLHETDGQASASVPHVATATTTDRASFGANLHSQLPTGMEKSTHSEVAEPNDESAEAGSIKSPHDGHAPPEEDVGTGTVPSKVKPRTDKGRENPVVTKKTVSSATAATVVQVTPTTSDKLVGEDEPEFSSDAVTPAALSTLAPSALSAASLRAHLANRGYYTTPGLRFGGALSVYPGDPFRYHAHFVATTYGWDEPIPLLDVVSQGRLATGVKKGLLISGTKLIQDSGDGVKEDLRAFSLEWAAI